MAQGIQGLDKLMKKYGQLAEEVAGQAMERAVGASTKLVQAEAKLLCPVIDGELKRSLSVKVETQENRTVGTVYTDKKHAAYVEFGTGPRGQADHAGISPEVTPAYTQKPWWIHESQIGWETAEMYHMFCLDTADGLFYQTSGQPAQPFLYPALKNNEDRVTGNIANYLAREIRKVCK